MQLEKGRADLGIAKGITAATFRYANQVGAVQNLVQDPVGAAMAPQSPGMAFGHFVLLSMFLRISRDVGDLEAAALYINDCINQPESIAALGLDRGIPPSALGREALASSLTETLRGVAADFGAIQDQIGPHPVGKPKGAGEVRDVFMRVGTDVTLGSVPAAASFVREAEAIVIRAEAVFPLPDQTP